MRAEKQKEKRDRLNKRNERIRADYTKEWARGFRNDKIVSDLIDKYSLDAKTIEAIVYKKGVYAEF